MAMRLVLVCEAATAWTKDVRVQGRLALPPLADELELLRELAKELDEISPEAVYCPPQDPALASAQVLRKALGLPLWKKDSLLPLDMGAWEGLSWSEVKERFGRLVRRYRAAPQTFAPPQAEALADAAGRLHGLVKELLGAGEDAIVVASAGILATLENHVLPYGEASGEVSSWARFDMPEKWPRWTEHELVTNEE